MFGLWQRLTGTSLEEEDIFAHLRRDQKARPTRVANPANTEYLNRIGSVLDTDVQFSKVPVVVDVTIDKILLFGFYASSQLPTMQNDHGVTHVINMAHADSEPNRQSIHEKYNVKYLGISAEDREDYDIMSHWEEVREFLCSFLDHEQSSRFASAADVSDDKCGGLHTLSPGRLLIHCMAGINRSGAMAVAIIAHLEKKSLLQAVDQVHQRRGPILTNIGFRHCLIDWARIENMLE